MDYKQIDILLTKYFDGDSSLGEEKVLSDYFKNNDNVPEYLAYAKVVFAHLSGEKRVEYPHVNKYRLQKRLVVAAASLLLMLGLVHNSFYDKEEIVYCYVNGEAITDELQALNQVQEVLYLVSENLNRGTEDLEVLSKFYNSTSLISMSK